MCLRMEKPISLWFLEGNVTVSAAESLLLRLIAFTMFDSIDKEWKLIFFFFLIVKPPSELPCWILLYGCSVKTDNYTFLKMKNSR